jgi:hypothetical protein
MFRKIPQAVAPCGCAAQYKVLRTTIFSTCCNKGSNLRWEQRVGGSNPPPRRFNVSNRLDPPTIRDAVIGSTRSRNPMSQNRDMGTRRVGESKFCRPNPNNRRITLTRFIATILIFTSILPFDCMAQSHESRPLVVSLIQLIATPERFDGKKVVVVGFLRLEHEANLLYLNKDDYDNVVLANTMWIDVTEAMGRDRDKLTLKYARIEGTFRAGNRTKNSTSAGGITDITSCKFWSDPANPLEKTIQKIAHSN